MAPTQPNLIPSRMQEGGRLAVSRKDFRAHYEGGGFRHTADQVDMNPPIPAIGEPDVQKTLEAIFSSINSSGVGFISIGHSDGYSSDGYAIGNYNVNDTTSFVEAFDQALQDRRLTNGGIILILAGSYIIDKTIEIPKGITILGDLSGTYLIGQTIEQSLFKIKVLINTIEIGGNAALSQNSNITDQNGFWNIAIFDNLNQSFSSMTTVPMIELEKGSNLYCRNVSFFGKLNDGASLNRSKTKNAIGNISGINQGTTLKIENCYFDGFKVPIQFSPALGEKDFCTILDSKFRFFGKESASYDNQQDCCFLLTPCNAQIKGNYVIGAGSNSKTFITLKPSANISNDLKIIICNNNGVPSNESGILIDNQSNEDILNILSYGNNWGYSQETSWYLTVGTGIGNSYGNLFGEKSLDLALQWANNSDIITTIIINQGSYTITADALSSNNFSKVKLIGNKVGKKYPLVQLDISSIDIDNINQKFIIIGNHLEGIYFTSLNEFQSIRPSFDIINISSQKSAHLITVKDCVFVNTTLNIFDPGSGADFIDQQGFDSIAQIYIKNCSFIQDASFNDSIGLISPIVHQTIAEDCYFIGAGYTANFGNELYSLFTGINRSVLNLNNITCNLNNFNISNIGPTIPSSSYFIINDPFAKIFIDNCQILANENLDSYTPIDSSLITGASIFTKFIKIIAQEINISNSIFNGPNQSFQMSGNDYAIPCLYINPKLSLNFSNNKICSGGLPLQIADGFDSITTQAGIKINNNNFSTVDDNITQTVLDIDIDSTNLDFRLFEINISNNSFVSKVNAVDSIQILHEYVIGESYDTNGFVQIYAKGIDIDFSNNKLYGTIVESSFGSYNYYSGLFINTYNSDSGITSKPTNEKILNNIIQIKENNFTSSSSTKGAGSLKLRTCQTLIDGNTLVLGNNAALSNSLICCLILEIIAINDAGSAIVSNNFFSRLDDDGNSTRLVKGYINIFNTTTIRGQIVNNQFNNSTFDDTLTQLIFDNTILVANNWWSEKNKNESKTLIVRGNSGSLGIKDTANTYFGAVGGINNITTSELGFLYSASSTIAFIYNDTTFDQIINWSIPLHALIPIGAYIVSATVDVDVSANPSVTSIATLFLKKVGLSNNDTVDPLTTAGATLTLNPTTNVFVSNSEQALTTEITMRINSNVRAIFTASPITIVYRW